jgi:outer membrane protein TolC
MGLAFGKIDSLPPASDQFPVMGEQELPELSATPGFIDQAFARRADLLASRHRQESALLLLKAANNNVKPQLDLLMDVSYAGLDEGTRFARYFTPLTQNVPGLNISATLQFERPVENNFARGVQLQSGAIYQQLVIQTADLERNIRSGVLVALSNLKQSALRLNEAQQAVLLHQAANENEKKKLQQGWATVIDVILTEERLTNALQNQLDAARNYALALVRLRFETGTLLTADANQNTVGLEELITVPAHP